MARAAAARLMAGVAGRRATRIRFLPFRMMIEGGRAGCGGRAGQGRAGIP
jgi:hypothetical protein